MQKMCARQVLNKEKFMTRKHWLLLVSILLFGLLAWQVFGKAAESTPQDKAGKLVVLWTSGDPEVAHKVCFMYTHNAKRAGWFDEVTLIVWGPSSRLLAGDKAVQQQVKDMMADGVTVQACVVCADMYGVSDRLREMNIEVKAMGKPLTEMLKSDWKMLTF
jgi:hypothetical protein